MGIYDVAEMCANGHHTTSMVNSFPEFRSSFCPKCGEPTFTECPHCESDIRGRYDHEGFVISFSGYEPPSYCHNCGTHIRGQSGDCNQPKH